VQSYLYSNVGVQGVVFETSPSRQRKVCHWWRNMLKTTG